MATRSDVECAVSNHYADINIITVDKILELLPLEVGLADRPTVEVSKLVFILLRMQ